MSRQNLDDAYAIAQHNASIQPHKLGTLVQVQRIRDPIFDSQKGYRIEKHVSHRRIRFRGTTFKVPDDFDREGLLDPCRV